MHPRQESGTALHELCGAARKGGELRATWLLRVGVLLLLSTASESTDVLSAYICSQPVPVMLAVDPGSHRSQGENNSPAPERARTCAAARLIRCIRRAASSAAAASSCGWSASSTSAAAVAAVASLPAGLASHSPALASSAKNALVVRLFSYTALEHTRKCFSNSDSRQSLRTECAHGVGGG